MAARHVVLTLAGRGDLVFHDLHGEPLYLHPLRAIIVATGPVLVDVGPDDVARVRGEVGARRLSAQVAAEGTWWESVQRRPEAALLAVDPLCPLVTAEFVAGLAERAAAEPEGALVAYRPVTDTLKAVDADRILGTVDRDSLATVTSPVVVPPSVLARAVRDDDRPPLRDFAALVAWLRERTEVELVRAPSLGRRVEHAPAVHLLEHIDQVGHRVRVARGGPRSAPEDPS